VRDPLIVAKGDPLSKYGWIFIARLFTYHADIVLLCADEEVGSGLAPAGSVGVARPCAVGHPFRGNNIADGGKMG
jgi:hypothetical protein